MGVLCLGVHGTWKAGGADAGEGAVVIDEDEVLKDLPEAGEYAPFVGVGYLGLFGLRLRGSWSVQGCLLRCVGEEEAAGQERKILDF